MQSKNYASRWPRKLLRFKLLRFKFNELVMIILHRPNGACLLTGLMANRTPSNRRFCSQHSQHGVTCLHFYLMQSSLQNATTKVSYFVLLSSVCLPSLLPRMIGKNLYPTIVGKEKIGRGKLNRLNMLLIIHSASPEHASGSSDAEMTPQGCYDQS